MTQLKQEGVKDYNKIYLNIIEDYDKILDEVKSRPEIRIYSQKENEEILSQYPISTQKQLNETADKMNAEAQEKAHSLFTALMMAGKNDQARRFLDPSFLKKTNEKLQKKIDDMFDEANDAIFKRNTKADELNQYSLLADTINGLKIKFDKIKNAKMKSQGDPDAELIRNYVNKNPIMKQIFNEANTEAASEVWDYSFDDDATRDALYPAG